MPLFSCITKSIIRYYSVTIKGENFIGRDKLNPKLFFNKAIYNTIKHTNQNYHLNKNYFYLSEPEYRITIHSHNYRTYPLLMFTQLGNVLIRNSFDRRFRTIKYESMYFNTLFFIHNNTKDLLVDFLLNNNNSSYAKKYFLIPNLLQSVNTSDRYVFVLSFNNSIIYNESDYDWFDLFNSLINLLINMIERNIQMEEVREIKHNFKSVYTNIFKTIKTSELNSYLEKDILNIRDKESVQINVYFNFIYSIFIRKAYYILRISLPKEILSDIEDSILFISELKNNTLYTSLYKKEHQKQIENIFENLETTHDFESLYKFLAKKTNLLNNKLKINNNI